MISAVFSYIFSFRFINLVWMIVCCFYAVKRWVLPGLKEAILEQKKKIATIRTSIQAAQADQKEMVQARESQDRIGKELFTKISLWNQCVQGRNMQAEQAQRTYNHAYNHYRTTQYHAVEFLYGKRVVQQEVFDKTLDDLTALYDGQKLQHEFIQKGLLQMNEEK